MVSSPRVKLLFDIYHMQIMQGDVIRTLRKMIGYVGHIHTAGNPGRNEIDDTQELNYSGICRAIAATAYDGYVGSRIPPSRRSRESPPPGLQDLRPGLKRNMTRPLPVIAIAGSLLLAACSPAGNGKVSLIVYSPHGKELLSDHEVRFEARHPGVDVKWLDMGKPGCPGPAALGKEQSAGGYLVGAPSDLFEQAGEEALLLPYRPTWAEAVPPEARGSGGFWYGTYKTPEVIAYNSAC